MNIYDYFCSADIAEYCRSIGHNFSPIEMACIIDNSDKTIRQKNLAFQELIQDYPDMPFHDSVDFYIKSSLHDYLRALIKYRETVLRNFEDAANTGRTCYTLSDYDVNKMGLVEKRPCFSTLDELWEFIRPHWSKAKRGYVRILRKISMRHLNFIYVDYDINREAVLIDDKYVVSKKYDLATIVPKGPGNLHDLFIDIPSPFREGDIISDDSGPAVLKAVPHSAKNYAEIESGSKKIGFLFPDRPNFAVYYYLNQDGILSDSFPDMELCTGQGFGWPADRLEYYKKPLKDNEQILLQLSNYIKANGTEKISEMLNKVHPYGNPDQIKIIRELGKYTGFSK